MNAASTAADPVLLQHDGDPAVSYCILNSIRKWQLRLSMLETGGKGRPEFR